MAAAMMSMQTSMARTGAFTSTQSKSLVGTPMLPVRSFSTAPASRSAAVITRAGPLDNFNKTLKSKPKYDPSAKRVDNPSSAFTRRRELLTGRLAMAGFFACIVGELFTGKGAIGQLSLETLLPRPVVLGLVASLVLYNTVTALNPASPTFSEENQRDVRKRPAGGVQRPNKVDPIQRPQQFLGVSDSFGFTKANELFVGRVAMLGFAAEVIGEVFQGGKGPLGQLGLPMPAYAQYAGFGLAGWIFFFFAAAVGSGNFPGEQQGGEDIY